MGQFFLNSHKIGISSILVTTEVNQNDEIRYNPINPFGRLHYSGSTKGGRPDGKGTMLWNYGRKYE